MSEVAPATEDDADALAVLLSELGYPIANVAVPAFGAMQPGWPPSVRGHGSGEGQLQGCRFSCTQIGVQLQ